MATILIYFPDNQLTAFSAA